MLTRSYIGDNQFTAQLVGGLRIQKTEVYDGISTSRNIVIDDIEGVSIKRKDQKDLVLISLQGYSSLVETGYLLKGKNREILLASIAEVTKGNKEQHELIEE